MTNQPIIRARGLTKRFTVSHEQVEAVTDLDLDIAHGELVAFLGPNGAGKSTSLRMLTTLLRPTSGTATVVGHDIGTDPAGVRRRIGYVGQGNSAGYHQRVRDELLSQGAFYGMARVAAARRADELLESLDLASLAKRQVSGLSGGQKRRLDIALGLIHSPELLFLDEPSTGLDPQSRANLWEHVQELRRNHGTTIFVTTHYLEEADQFAERVLVMDHGRVIADDTAAELKCGLAGDVITLTLEAAADVGSAVATCLRVTGAAAEVTAAGTIELVVQDGARLLPRLLRELDASGTGVSAANIRQPTLDDVFLALTGRSLREDRAERSAASTRSTGTEERPADGLSAEGLSAEHFTEHSTETTRGTVDA